MSWRHWQPGPDASPQEHADAIKGFVRSQDGFRRCWWAHVAEEFLEYHDLDWGWPVADDAKIFEALCFELFQTGLSVLTVLRRRVALRSAFAGFELDAVARFDEGDVQQLLLNAGVIRHRAKIEAVVSNARTARDLVARHASLAHYVWQFEPDAVTRGPDRAEFERCSETEASRHFASEMKRQGWRFLGPTTAHSFMQAVGLVNDHVGGCDYRRRAQEARASFSRP